MMLESETLLGTADHSPSSIWVTVGVSSARPAAHGGAAGKARKVSAPANERTSMEEAKRKNSARRRIQRKKASSGGSTKCNFATSKSRLSHQCSVPFHHHFWSS